MPESLVVLRHCEDVLLELTSCCGLRSAQQRVSSKATFTLSIRPSQGSVKAGAIQQHRPQMPPRREWFTISVVDAIHAGPALGFHNRHAVCADLVLHREWASASRCCFA